MYQNQLMGLRVDIKNVDKEIEKAKKMLNVMTESHPCYEMTDEERKQLEFRNQEVERLNDEIRTHLDELDVKIKANLESTNGIYGDEVSLFT